MKEDGYQPVESSPNRIINIMKQNKKIFVHVIAHHVAQLVMLFICLLIISISFTVTYHSTGIVILSIELSCTFIAMIVYVGYAVLLFFSFRTHPVFIAKSEGKPFLLKLTNIVHLLYLILLICCFFFSVILAITFNPHSKFHNGSTDGLFSMLLADFIFFTLSAGEFQKPLLIINRKEKTVELNDENGDNNLKDTSYENKIGVYTLGYNILGFQMYVKYHFDPCRYDIQTEIYIVGKVKEIN